MTTSSISIEGWVALITGAGSGLGRAVSVAMSKAGASLILTDINAAKLQETAAICQAGQPLEFIPADIVQSDILSSIVRRGNEAVGRLPVSAAQNLLSDARLPRPAKAARMRCGTGG